MKIRWGLIGYGDLAAKRVAAALKEAPHSELAGVWGRSHDKAKAFAATQGVPYAANSIDDLLGHDIDAVYVCTPPDTHREFAAHALGAKKHVLVEKPMACSTADCADLVDRAKTTGKKLGVAYYRRAYPKMQRVSELIREGILGDLTWVNIVSHSWFSPGPKDANYWRVESDRSGGAGPLSDIGVHRLDLLEHWLGPSRVAYASRQNLAHQWSVEDSCSAVLSLANGAPVHVLFSWNSKTWMDRFEIVGTEAKILLEPLDGPDLVVTRGREATRYQIEPPKNAHLPLIADFVEACLNDRPSLCSGVDGARPTQLVEEILAKS
jgi:1,5-anhydro-D-fructose reductase (1,5-anhydro-D-mannitol-forming)